MQPCSREMQGINSLLNSSQISLQDLHNNPQIQNSHMNTNHQNQHHQQLDHTTTTPHFDPGPHDDFLEQMLSILPSCSWPDLNPNKPLWDPNHSLHISNSNSVNAADVKPTDLSDETAPSSAENVAFLYDEHASLASKFRNHQISGASPTAKAAAAVGMMLQQQQLLLSRGVAGADSGLLQMPLSLGGNDVVDASPFKSPNPGAEASVQALNGFAGSLHATCQASNQTQHFQHPQGSSNPMQGQNFGAAGVGGATNQSPTGGAPAQPKQRVRARRGQATDPHSIAERLRRERIAERMKALQELVPNANKTDKASMLDEIIDYVKFLQLQVKVLSMSRLGGAAAVAPLVADMSSEGGGDCIQTNGSGNGVGTLHRNSNGNKTTASTSNDSLTMTEHQVAKLMEEDMGSAMQYLQGKGLCLMPISLATAISTATCHPRNPLINGGANNQIPTTNGGGVGHVNPAVGSNAEGPSSPNMSVLTVQSVTAGNDVAVKDAASVSKP